MSTAGAVSAVEAQEALQLLLDSERVYEDLEYALRGPSGVKDNNSHLALSEVEETNSQQGGTSIISFLLVDYMLLIINSFDICLMVNR